MNAKGKGSPLATMNVKKDCHFKRHATRALRVLELRSPLSACPILRRDKSSRGNLSSAVAPCHSLPSLASLVVIERLAKEYGVLTYKGLQV